MQPDDVQAMEEVFAEAPVGHPGTQVDVRGGDDAHVDAARGDAAHRRELLLLHEAEQLALQVEGQLADLVEEDRGAVGLCEPAGLAGVGARERPLLVPEQLALDQGRRMAPQSTTTSGLSRRPLSSCTVWASISLPVPLSPVMRTVASVCATLRALASSDSMATER